MENKDLCELRCRVSLVSGVSEKTKKEFAFYTFNLEVGNYLIPLTLKDQGVSKQLLDEYISKLEK